MIRYIALLTTMLLLTVSCSGGSDTKTAQVATSAPTATPTSTQVPPTATPTPTQVPPSPTPTPEHLLDSEGKRIKVAEVSRIAWEDSQRILSLNSNSFSPRVDLLISVGPTTKPYLDNYEKTYQEAITFWSSFDQPTMYWALIYNYEDKSWAEEEIEKVAFLKHKDRINVDALCHASICRGANSGIEPDTSVGLGLNGIHQPDSRDPFFNGPLQIHEYTHAVQAAPWIGDYDPNQGHVRISPCWLHEGTAHFAGLSVGTDSYDDYQKIRAQQVWGDLFSPNPRVPSFDDFSPSKIVEYYDKSVPGQCRPNRDPHGHYYLGYSLGFLTVEALSTIGGSDSSMNLYKLMKNNTFPEAFALTYGSPWDETKHILASVVSANIFDIKNNIAEYR